MFEIGCSSIAYITEKSKEILPWFDFACDFSFTMLYSLSGNSAVDEESLDAMNRPSRSFWHELTKGSEED